MPVSYKRILAFPIYKSMTYPSCVLELVSIVHYKVVKQASTISLGLA